jgi:hypothetical protein
MQYLDGGAIELGVHSSDVSHAGLAGDGAEECAVLLFSLGMSHPRSFLITIIFGNFLLISKILHFFDKFISGCFR